jgi:hypothetical protein
MVEITMHSNIDFAYLRQEDLREVIHIYNTLGAISDRQDKAMRKRMRK